MDRRTFRYPVWIELYDTVDPDIRASLRGLLDALQDPPLISILLPVYNPPEAFLRQAIDSVRNQLYVKWELCIADDCSTLPHVAKVLEEYAAMDNRIRVIRRETNGHISACSNSALSLASGQWICLMDHDDLLAEHALAMAVLAIVDAPAAGLLYSDEDHIGITGARENPYFKPDFDPLLILGQNYFSHLCMMRADLVAGVGGFRTGLEGSQDWDLVLRVLEQLDPAQILHVPHVLYHWRSHPDSTASSIAAKPYVVEASRRAVQDHLDRIGVQATARTIPGTSFNSIEWHLNGAQPKVSIIILPRSGSRLGRCIDSIRIRSTYQNLSRSCCSTTVAFDRRCGSTSATTSTGSASFPMSRTSVIRRSAISQRHHPPERSSSSCTMTWRSSRNHGWKKWLGCCSTRASAQLGRSSSTLTTPFNMQASSSELGEPSEIPIGCISTIFRPATSGD